MKRSLKVAMPVTVLACSLLICWAFVKPSRSFDLKVDYDAKSHNIFLSITNQTGQEVAFDTYDSVKHKFDWRLCSDGAVIKDSRLNDDPNSSIPADHFPTAIVAHNGCQISLSEYCPQLERVLTNSNWDCLLWHWCVWDKTSRTWIQECGVIDLKNTR
jgi:hypothetical protein